MVLSPTIGVLLGAGFAAGVLLISTGLRRRPPAPVKARIPIGQRWAAATRRPSGRAGRRRDLKLTAVALLALAVFAATGWFVALLVVPVGLLLIPWLLANQNTAGIERTSALETWVRSLRALLQGGSDNTLEGALRSSLVSTPAPIRPQVAALIARLNARWPTDHALAAWADDLADSTADVIAASLMLASRRRGYGLSEVLAGLSESVADEVRARRKIESDRGSARTAARYMTVLSAGLAATFALFNPAFLAPYRTGLGQIILVAIIVAYVGVLALLRRMTTARDNPRILPTPAVRVTGGGPYAG